MILVTCYTNPDLDGVACGYAYAEYLRKTGRNAVAGFFGTVYKEAQFVFKKFKIPNTKNADKIIDKCDQIIMVDASELSGTSNKINPSKVIEIIDHRKVNDSHKFPNANVQIEFVGAAATLIAEKFHDNKVPISKDAAALLASAIISNTINFKAQVTTNRDVKMYKWLMTKIKLPKNYVHEMFAYKSKIGKPLKRLFLDDKFAVFNFCNKRVGVVQLEVTDLKNFIEKNIAKIKSVITEIKKERRLDVTILTCIDIEKGFNVFVVTDKLSEQILSDALKINFDKGIANRKGIIMRKEIIPLVKDVME